ncbi:MAG: hypothetical protein ACRERX_06975, partial [Pseudomonas sp.]
MTWLVRRTLLVGLCSLTTGFAWSDSKQSLEQAANDPTASLMSVQLEQRYTGDYYQLDDESANATRLRVAMPFQTGELKHIARFTVDHTSSSPAGKSGWGDLTLFDLLVRDESWGRWGVGLVMLLPTATDDALGNEKWAVGPAIGFVKQEDKALFGLFNQNLFTVAGDDDREDVNVSILQPIVNLKLPDKWFIGSSEMNITYDWRENDWTSLPLGFKAGKLIRLGERGVPI